MPDIENGDTVSIKYELTVIGKNGELALDFNNLKTIDVKVSSSAGIDKYNRPDININELRKFDNKFPAAELENNQDSVIDISGVVNDNNGLPENDKYVPEFKTNDDIKLYRWTGVKNPPKGHGRVSLSYKQIMKFLDQKNLNDKHKQIRDEIKAAFENATTKEEAEKVINHYELELGSNRIGGKTKKRPIHQKGGKKTRRY